MIHCLTVKFYNINQTLGLTDKATEGTFVWGSDNVEATYTNWYGTEPNNHGNEDCAHIRPQKLSEWNDSKCQLQHSNGRPNTALCQKF